MANSVEEIQQSDRRISNGVGTTVIGAGAFLATLDLFIVNVAFPDIRASFPGTTTQDLSWVLTAYGILFAALLVPAGRLADVYGLRRMFRTGLAVFAVASAACAAAPSVGLLVAGRAVQACGAALIVPTSLGLMLATYPAERHRHAVGLWAAIGGVAAACGPPIGGLLVQADWRWIFLVNVPIAAAAAVLAGRLPEPRRHGEGGLPDLLGAALLAIGIAGLVAAISNLQTWGARSGWFWLAIVGGVIALVVFTLRCRRHPRPVVDLALLRHRQFSAATVAMACFYAGFGVMLLGGTLYLTQVWHYGSIRAGLAFAPGPAMAATFAIIGSRLPIDRRWLAIAGSSLFAVAALWWLRWLGPTPDYIADYLPALLLSGTGVGLSQASIIGAGASVLPPRQYATGTGIINTSRQVGSAIGVAILVGVLGAGLVASDYHAAFVVMAGCGVLAAVAAAALRRDSHHAARATD